MSDKLNLTKFFHSKIVSSTSIRPSSIFEFKKMFIKLLKLKILFALMFNLKFKFLLLNISVLSNSDIIAGESNK